MQINNKKVTKQNIYDIANQIVLEGLVPTHSTLRNKLGKGSNSTIHKYFTAWKKERFGVANNTEHNLHGDDEYTALLEKYRILELLSNKQIAQNEHYAQELINAEKANIALKEENNQIQVQLQKVKLELNELKKINNVLEQITTEIKNKLENNDNKTIENLQQIIEGLKAELKKLNETSLEALREASAKGHDTLMQEKVNSINLQTKVDSLYKELIDLKKQLSDTILKHQIQTQTLLRQINEQQKIIQDHIGLEKLRELVGEQQLILHFNNKSGVDYGK